MAKKATKAKASCEEEGPREAEGRKEEEVK